MNTVVQLPDDAVACTIREVVSSLRDQKVESRHEKKAWGDWIESNRGLTSTATIEHAEDEPDGLALQLQAAFHGLGWVGVDEDGSFPLG